MPVDYKYKPDKHKFRVNIKTIDEFHKEYLDKFKKDREMIPEKKLKLKSLEKELRKLEKETNGKPINLDMEILKKRNTLKKSIKTIKDDIENINNCNAEMDYYSRTGDVLYDYYDLVNGILYAKNFDEPLEVTATNTNAEKPKPTEKTHEKNSSKIEISDELLAITNLNKTRKMKRPVRKRNKKTEITETKSVMSYLLGSDDEKEDEQEKNNSLYSVQNRATLQNEYLLMVDDEYPCSKKHSNHIYKCKRCNLEKMVIHAEAIVSCPKCGESDEIFIESDIPSQRETFTEKPKYPYKRIGHCIEKLNQFLCKGNANVPAEVFTTLDEEIEKHGMVREDVTIRFLEKMLKKHRLSDYYENIMFIYSRITNKPPQSISREEYELVLEMFKEAEEIYEKRFKPRNRDNFLKYTFVLNKIFLLIGRKDIAPHFKLLKNPVKMKEQENIWKNMCNALGWNKQKIRKQMRAFAKRNMPPDANNA